MCCGTIRPDTPVEDGRETLTSYQGNNVNTTNLPRRREIALAVCVSLGLTACGGGGGSVPSYNIPKTVTPQPPSTPSQPTTPTQPQPPSDVQLAATGADVAHAAKLTGAGAVIGIVDSGVTAASPALSGRVVAKLNYVDPRANNLNVDDVVGHGTAVAEIAAGRPFGQFAGGVAPDATIVSARIVSDTEPKDDGSGNGNKVTSADPLGSVNDAVYQAGARISNNSWGGVYWDATDTAVTASFADAYKHAGSLDTLYVFAAGNDSRANPSDIAALPLRVPNLAGGWIAVVALDSNNTSQIASYSNRCGDAKAFCVAAPGAVVTLAASSTAAKPAYQVWTGTSLAAPQVAGAAAVLSSTFPQFNTDSVRQLILGTADDLGDPGVDAVYGNGRLNLGKAILGPSRLDFGRFNADIGTANVTFSNDISGSGDLNVLGSGKLTLTGKNSFGALTVSGTSTVEVMNDVPDTLTIAGTGARAIVHGDIGRGGSGANRSRVDVNGTLQLAAHPAQVNADLTMYGPSRLSVLLGAPVTVNGTTQLYGGDLYIAGATPGYTVTSHQSVLTATSVSGRFTTTTLAQGVFLAATVQYAPKEIWVDTTSLKVTAVAGASAVMSGSAAAMTSATRLDGAFEQIQGALASPAASVTTPSTGTLVAAGQIQQSRTDAVAKASLESLSGQLYAAGTAVTLAGIDAGNDALIAHLDQQGTGAWTQSLGYQGGMSRGGYGNVGFNLNGGLAGHDVRLGINGFAGVAVAQMSSRGQLNGSFDSQRSRSTAGMFYAGSRGAQWYGVGQVGFGSFRGDMRRLLRFGDQAAFAGSDQNGSYNSAYGEVGFRSQAGAFTVTPFANVQYASIRRGGFSESGGDGFGLTADGHTTSRWQAGFGLRAGSSWLTTRGAVHLDAKLGWQNAFATRGEVFAARYTGFAQWAPVDGIGLSRRAGTAGMSLGWDMTASTQLGFNVDQRFADRDHSRSANASFRMAW